MPTHTRKTASLQLRGAQHRDSHEMEDAHAVRWTDHRALAHGIMPK
jgi:hypothetical protein